MTDKIYACQATDVPEGEAKILTLKNRSIGVFKLQDGFYALLNTCPHRGAPLCEGPVCGTAGQTDRPEFVYEKAGELVRCAWHGWEFDIRTGSYLVDPKVRARSFPVTLEDDALYVHM